MRAGEDNLDQSSERDHAGFWEAQIVLKGLQQWLLQQERQRERLVTASPGVGGEELAILRLLVEDAECA
jgi:hypothetical protein